MERVMKKLVLFGLFLLVSWCPNNVFAACKPTSCSVSSGDDRLNADTLENTSKARKSAASCYICEPDYCEDGDIVYLGDFSRFMVCRQSPGWIGNDRWETYTPEYCLDETDLTVSFNRGNTGLAKYWKIDGVKYGETQATKNAATTTQSGQNVCFYYGCPDNYKFDVEVNKCVSSQSSIPPVKEEDAPEKLKTPAAQEGGGQSVSTTQSCVESRCGGLSGTAKSQCITCCYVSSSIAVWNSATKICECADKSLTFDPVNLSCEAAVVEEEVQNQEPYECDPVKIEQLSSWVITYASNNQIVAQINQVFSYCADNPNSRVFDTQFLQIKNIVDRVISDEDAKELNQKQIAWRDSISKAAAEMDDIKSGLKLTVWKDEEGNFNTSRLLSDSIAGVVLGTAGGLITSNVVKKNQVENGFEDIQCSIGGQVVAGWGDEFRVGIQ